MFDPSPKNLLLAALGMAIILANWLPRFVSGREPAASALLIGLGWLAFALPGMPAAPDPVNNPRPWEIVSELCVIIGLFGVGLRIDNLSNRRRWMPTIRLLAVAMPLTILAVALLGVFAGGMTLAGALLLGAVLAPTDPVLASDIQVGPPLEGGEHPVRLTLTAEAGLNDGLAFPFLHLALAIAAAGALSGDLLVTWLWRDVLLRIAVGLGAGIGIGWLLAQLVFNVPRANPLARTEAGVVALAGVLVVYGVTQAIGGYGFIAVFVAGLAMRQVESRHDFNVRLHNFAESLERALTAVLLVGLGAALPALLPFLTWQGALIGAALILIIRPVIGLAALQGTILDRRSRLVVAFYGIRGIGSINYIGFAGSHMDLIDKGALWAIVAFTILLSTIVHGFTAGAAVERATARGAPKPGARSRPSAGD